MGFGGRPAMSADDITHPERSVFYELAFLPGTDAFYTFQGFFGERRSLPGRDGPPGARYNTLPGLKPLPAQILDGYWRERHEGDWGRYLGSREGGAGPAGFARARLLSRAGTPRSARRRPGRSYEACSRLSSRGALDAWSVRARHANCASLAVRRFSRQSGGMRNAVDCLSTLTAGSFRGIADGLCP